MLFTVYVLSFIVISNGTINLLKSEAISAFLAGVVTLIIYSVIPPYTRFELTILKSFGLLLSTKRAQFIPVTIAVPFSLAVVACVV